MRNNVKKTMACFLSVAMLLSAATPAGSKTVQAEETQITENSSTAKTVVGLGSDGIKDPVNPEEDSSVTGWMGSYVYYGKYDTNGDEIAEAVKYRVLDAETTEYSADRKTRTMLLDCDNVLYEQKFDADGKANDWSVSDVKTSLNGEGFLEKDGVFTAIEKNAIANSQKDSVNALDGAGWQERLNWASLNGEKIFLLDAKEVTRATYGYRNQYNRTNNRMKLKFETVDYYFDWWLRSSDSYYDNYAGSVNTDGAVMNDYVGQENRGVSPALNLDLASVLFSSVVQGTAGEKNAEYKLTLLDEDMSVTSGEDVLRKGDTVTIPYSIRGDHSDSVTQVSVLILDKEYKTGNTEQAQILYYGALKNIKDAEGAESTVSVEKSGTGTFILPSSLEGKTAGTDYYIYLLAEHINEDNSTDYASEPLELEMKTVIKLEHATAPEVPEQFANYYTADTIFSSTELGKTAKVTLEGNT